MEHVTPDTKTFDIEVGYGPQLLDYSRDHNFTVNFKALSRKPGLPLEEAKNTARLIENKIGKNPTLCLSGGLDSEVMALSFLEAGVKFEAVSLCFHNSLNFHDIRHAVDFCKVHGITHRLIELDAVRFIQNDNEYFHKYCCPSLEVSAQLWFADQIKRPFVWAGEAFRLFKSSSGLQIQSISEVEAAIYRFIKKNRLNSVPNFHFYNSELAWSFFKHSLQHISSAQSSTEIHQVYVDKFNYYTSAGFKLKKHDSRQRKLHGFEELKNFLDAQYKLSGRQDYNQQHRIPYHSHYPIKYETYLNIPKTDAWAREILGYL